MTTKHWLVHPANEPHMRAACRQPTQGNGVITADQVTCPDCLNAVIRSHCNAVNDEPGPLPARCSRPPHKHGSHDWVPGSQALRHADFARQSINVSMRNPQTADEYAAEAQRQADSSREDAERRLARLAGVAEEPVEVSTPSGRLPRLLGRWSA